MTVSIRDKTDLSHGGICRRDCNLPHKIVHALLDLNDIALKGVDTIFQGNKVLQVLIPPQQQFTQHPRRPPAKQSPLEGLHPVSNRNHHIQVIDLHRPVRICNVQILHIPLLVNLPFLDGIANVFRDDRPFPSYCAGQG